ncbi:MAG: hemolysin III family protein [Actinomycetota bacterium]|nr:hemolysin III family protein [Actinomycetota bacterium]
MPAAAPLATEAIGAVRARPRARGWIHFYSAILAALAGVTLVIMAATVSVAAALACGIYALTVIGLFSISATYHLHTWTGVRSRTWMKRADHSMIFIFIAGTYTPIAVLALPPSTEVLVLVIVWAGAFGGVALKVLWPHSPRWLGVPFYLALGWVAVFLIPDMLHAGGMAALSLILFGGLLYSVGAVFYATRRPNPWPDTFGYHEFFHAAVSLAALCHCVAIWLILY